MRKFTVEYSRPGMVTWYLIDFRHMLSDGHFTEAQSDFTEDKKKAMAMSKKNANNAVIRAASAPGLSAKVVSL